MLLIFLCSLKGMCQKRTKAYNVFSSLLLVWFWLLSMIYESHICHNGTEMRKILPRKSGVTRGGQKVPRTAFPGGGGAENLGEKRKKRKTDKCGKFLDKICTHTYVLFLKIRVCRKNGRKWYILRKIFPSPPLWFYLEGGGIFHNCPGGIFPSYVTVKKKVLEHY